MLEGYGTDLEVVNAGAKDEYFQLYNYDNSNAPGKDGCCGGVGRNKIEGGWIISLDEWPDKASFTHEYIGGKQVYHKEENDGLSNITTLRIPVPGSADKFVAMSIYGDPKNFQNIMETILMNFTFM